MKDILKRIFIGVFSGAFAGYVIYLMTQGLVLVQSEYVHLNMFSGILLILAALYFFVFFAIFPIYMKMTKAVVFTVGLGLIIFGHWVLNNDAQAQIYIGDIVKVFGVIVTILSPTNLLISEKQKKKKEESKMKVIEA